MAEAKFANDTTAKGRVQWHSGSSGASAGRSRRRPENPVYLYLRVFSARVACIPATKTLATWVFFKTHQMIAARAWLLTIIWPVKCSSLQKKVMALPFLRTSQNSSFLRKKTDDPPSPNKKIAKLQLVRWRQTFGFYGEGRSWPNRPLSRHAGFTRAYAAAICTWT